MYKKARIKKHATFTITFLLVLVMFFGSTIPANAAWQGPYGGVYIQYEGGFLGIGATKCRYYAYKDDVERIASYGFVAPIIHHKQNTGKFTLSFTRTITVSQQSAVNFSASVGYSVPAGPGNFTAGVTGGSTSTAGFSVAAAGGITKTIPTESKTGYYSMGVFRRYHWGNIVKFSTDNFYYSGSYYMAVPRGGAFYQTVYSKDNINWYLFK
ncbi:MAG: hypothetical protein LBD25_01945 [Coriobacteriales bacterium]|nr:hypothetical protein [Coriobacteriales bacterium]